MDCVVACLRREVESLAGRAAIASSRLCAGGVLHRITAGAGGAETRG